MNDVQHEIKISPPRILTENTSAKLGTNVIELEPQNVRPGVSVCNIPG